MHAVGLLHKFLRRSCPEVHLTRLEALCSAVAGVVRGRRLSVAGVGRGLAPGPRTKHRIKRIDRLAGNPHLAGELPLLYRAMTRLLVRIQPRPLILIDWSEASHDGSLHLLRASVVVDGRSLTLFEEVHWQRDYDARRVRERFLERLGACLSEGCRPILIADAGFRVSWFRQVEAMGWDWVGRVRYRIVGSAPWLPIDALHKGARTKASVVGEVELTEHGAHPCRLYRVRQPRRQRTDRTRHGKRRRDGRSRACAQRNAEPWVVATSLEGYSAEAICALYRHRTQIEGTFRDLKNAQWGLQLRAHRTRSPERLAVLVLLGSLASLVAFLTGLAGAALGIERHYQANTLKRRVPSFFYLGLELLRDAHPEITAGGIGQALRALRFRIAEVATA